MVFSSSIFLLYFLPVFLILYYLAAVKYKNYIALAASIVFYAWGAPDFIFIVILSVILDFYIVKYMYLSTGRRRRWLLFLSVLLNIGMLVYFKYSNFFVENVNGIFKLLGMEAIHWTKIILPIGISFFTFQKFTYGIDVYRGKHKPLDKVTDLALYILLFPQLIAGPIVRYSEIANDLVDRQEKETIDNKILGFYRFIFGLSKKVLIANVLGAEADKIFAMNPHIMSSGTAWIGIMAYTFQIYFDFSGYSDMAIGLGRMIGFSFPENFDNPYVSRSITEFWRRWHMTLGGWMRDYLYIPLGGNKVESKWRLYLNLWLVFLISGLWHGASWTFVIWGAYHGLFLILDRLFLQKILNKIGKFPSIVFTFFLASIGWVLFRSNNLDYAFGFLKRMFAFDFRDTLYESREFVVCMVFAIFFSFLTSLEIGKRIEYKLLYSPYSKTQYFIILFIVLILFVLSLSSIIASGFNPFIYFRF